MPRRKYQLPEGVRFLTDAELAERRAKKGAGKAADRLEGTAAKAAGPGWAFSLPKVRRRRRRRRPPAGIFRMPR